MSLHSVDVYRTHFMPGTLLGAGYTEKKGIPALMMFMVFWGRDKKSKYYDVEWDKNGRVFWQQGRGHFNSNWAVEEVKKKNTKWNPKGWAGVKKSGSSPPRVRAWFVQTTASVFIWPTCKAYRGTERGRQETGSEGSWRTIAVFLC